MNRSSETFANFTKALANLERTMTLPEDNENYRSSALFSFILAQETSWKAFRWVLTDKIGIEARGPKPVLQEAFALGWLGFDDQVWLEMVKDRNLVVRAYDEEDLPKIYQRVKSYVIALRQAHDLLVDKYPDLQSRLSV